MNEATLQRAGWRVTPIHEGSSVEGLRLEREWNGSACRAVLWNQGTAAVSVREVVILETPLDLPAETALYGEGFQMLSQTAGTLGAPEDVGGYTDRGHYRIPEAPGMTTVYGLALFSPSTPAETATASTAVDGAGGAGAPAAKHLLVAFSSCRRFVGSIRFGAGRLEVVIDAEGLTLQPGDAWELEEVWCASGTDREALLAALGERLAQHHPPLPFAKQPTGWCSWYWYGPRVSEADVLDNLRAAREHGLPLRYVQIDDGYQAAMGDWLEPGERFPGGLEALCRAIKEEGFEPAIWVAPFIAEPGSRLAREHPEWLVKDPQGVPLASNAISFGGWRRGPWFMLDGTHPGAQAYVEDVFRTMREVWGCHYFKLDALTWGALHGGVHHVLGATRIEAYRQGMAAVHRGAGPDSFILGCNAPMWGSLGVVHGMRVGGDIKRTWRHITRCARECFWRGWQHGRLWLNDPDCVVLVNRPEEGVTDEEFLFHATAILATGGLVLSSDNLRALTPEARDRLLRLLKTPPVAARFDDTTWRAASIALPNGEALHLLFNWEDEPAEATLQLPQTVRLFDFWTGKDLGTHAGAFQVGTLAPHSARALRLT